MITFVISTYNRFHLFQRTMDSFLSHCTDSHLITKWVIVDDGSTWGDCDRMLHDYPFFELVDAGHHGYHHARNLFFQYIQTPWALGWEDDWQTYRRGNLITEALDILQQNPHLIQCGFRYWPCPISNGFRQHIYTGQPTGPLGYQDHYCSHWPGFSFNPSLFRVDAIRPFLPCAETKVERRLSERIQKTHPNGIAYTIRGAVRHIGGGATVFQGDRHR